MCKFKTIVFIIIISLTFPKLCLANSEIQTVINSIEADSEELVGGAVAIVKNVKLIYKKTFGSKEINGAPIDENTLFGLASVSKAITATAIASLVDKQKANFEDELHINDVNLPLKNILSHTTGYRITGDSEIENGASRKKLLQKIRREDKTGSKKTKPYLYNNLSYSLTQEYAKSKGYSMNELIGVLGISSYTLPINTDNLAYPHSKDQKRLKFPSHYQTTVPTSAGVFSSLNGMVEFLQITLGNRPNIVSQRTLNHIFEPVTNADDIFTKYTLPFKDSEVNSSYCLGWRKFSLKSKKNSTLIFHSGYIDGATAFVGILPEHKIGIVILANQSSRFPLKKGLMLWKSIIDSDK